MLPGTLLLMPNVKLSNKIIQVSIDWLYMCTNMVSMWRRKIEQRTAYACNILLDLAKRSTYTRKAMIKALAKANEIIIRSWAIFVYIWLQTKCALIHCLFWLQVFFSLTSIGCCANVDGHRPQGIIFKFNGIVSCWCVLGQKNCDTTGSMQFQRSAFFKVRHIAIKSRAQIKLEVDRTERNSIHRKHFELMLPSMSTLRSVVHILRFYFQSCNWKIRFRSNSECVRWDAKCRGVICVKRPDGCDFQYWWPRNIKIDLSSCCAHKNHSDDER